MNLEKRDDESQTAWAIRAIRMEERARVLQQITNYVWGTESFDLNDVIAAVNSMED